MKRLAILITLLALSSPCFAARKATINELKAALSAMRDARKSDADVATRLKEVDLAEQLTGATRKALQEFAPGPLSTEQLEILEGRTAVLPPPAAELPGTAAPDPAAQKALLAKAVDYVTGTYMHNPRLQADRTTTRFQDGVTGINVNSGVTNNMPSTNAHPWEPPNMFMRLVGSRTAPVESEKGMEIVPPVTQKQPWGQNGQISEGGTGPMLGVILQEAAAAGTLAWKRWETVRGHTTAVFGFSVPKKKSHYEVHYCCFPVSQDFGRMGYEGTGANLQYATEWKDFHSIVGYHGEFFVDAETGTILRVATQAELKPTDFVHQEDMRIDYGPVSVDGKNLTVPIESFTLNEVVPNGDNYGARYSVRHTLFHMVYGEYRPAH